MSDSKQNWRILRFSSMQLVEAFNSENLQHIRDSRGISGEVSPEKEPAREFPAEPVSSCHWRALFFGDTRNRTRCTSCNSGAIRLSRRLSRALLEIFRGGWFMGQASTSPLVDSPRVREAYILILVTPWVYAKDVYTGTLEPLELFRVEEIWYVQGGITPQLKIIICYPFDIWLKT